MKILDTWIPGNGYPNYPFETGNGIYFFSYLGSSTRQKWDMNLVPARLDTLSLNDKKLFSFFIFKYWLLKMVVPFQWKRDYYWGIYHCFPNLVCFNFRTLTNESCYLKLWLVSRLLSCLGWVCPGFLRPKIIGPNMSFLL